MGATGERVNVPAEVTEVRRRLKAVAVPSRAEAEKKYLKSDLQFLGATVPQVRADVVAFSRAHQGLTAQTLRSLAAAAWQTRLHELRSWAVFLLERHVELLGLDDLAWLETFLREAKTWALVDELAVRVVGPIVREAGAAGRGVLRRYARDEDFWIRRTALLALLLPLREGGGDFALFEELAVPMLGEKEFFIRKAAGWVLREVAKRRPALTYGFLRAHRDAMSGLTLREGAKPLSPAQRKTLGLSGARDSGQRRGAYA